jgi:hypothetical protein
MKEFNRKKDPGWVPFKVNGEEYRASNTCPALAMLDVARVNGTEGIEQVTLVMAFLDTVLEEDSAKLFAERMKDPRNPIDIDELTQVAVWLVEEVYVTERPTEAPSPSPNGSGSTGPSTTGTASTEDSTPESSTRRVL